MKVLPLFLILLLGASLGTVFGGGYQKTRDGKTFVWNNRPQPNDIAVWNGQTDNDGYASGYGTLIWYAGSPEAVIGSNIPKTKLNLIARYTGTMVHGKLDGPVVNVDADGKTYHGTFVDGHKSKQWFAGPPGKDASSQVAKSSAKHEESSAEGEPIASKSPAPAADKSNGPIVETPAEGPDENASPATAVHRRPTPPPVTAADENRPPSHDLDDSLRSLVGPPVALQNKPASEPSAAPKTTSETSAPATPPAPPQPSVHLSGARAGTIADAEARAQGYNVDEYRRSEASYNGADETWSVSYEQPTANGVGKRFTVTVSDKTEKAAISSR